MVLPFPLNWYVPFNQFKNRFSQSYIFYLSDAKMSHVFIYWTLLLNVNGNLQTLHWLSMPHLTFSTCQRKIVSWNMYPNICETVSNLMTQWISIQFYRLENSQNLNLHKSTTIQSNNIFVMMLPNYLFK